MLLLFGFLLMVVIFAFTGILSGAMAMFIDLPSFLLIVIPLLFFLGLSKGGGVIGRYFTASFKKEFTYTLTELESLSRAVKNTIKFILATGGFGFMAGLIATFSYIGAPEMLGPNFAICLLTLTYSIAFSFFVFFPLQAWAENRIGALQYELIPRHE